ncbi:hypothetical protein BB560_004542, partial [Smittium megazygosporum]
AIGRKINLILGETKSEVAKRTGRPIESIGEDEYDAVVIHGEELATMTDEDWDQIFHKPEVIFARTSPKNKLEIVNRAQSLGHIVGVTGDGVNDSPALKQSDLGIAMNISGSDVSKEAASMILLDDNFASITNGIEEGRLIFENLKKSIKYTVSHSVPEAIPQILYILVPFPVIIGALQIIAIDLGCDLLNALSYAWEPSESNESLMKLIPRNPVTMRSIMQLRERNERHAFEIDPETNKPYPKSTIKKIVDTIKGPFTRLFWQDITEKKYGDSLISGDLLLYGYIELGIIMTVGCFITWILVLRDRGLSLGLTRRMMKDGYFKDDSPTYNQDGKVFTQKHQIQYSREASTAYFLGVFFIQSFNLFVCKTRINLPFGRYMFKNKRTFLMLFLGAVVVMLISYVPPFNVVFVTSRYLKPIWWLVPLAFGVFLLAYCTVRILVLRRLKPIGMNPDITGLQMHPTICQQLKEQSVWQRIDAHFRNENYILILFISPSIHKASGTMSKNAKNSSEKDESQIIIDYLEKINRPVNATDIANSMQGTISKTNIQKILTSLADSGQIIGKQYGKQSIYCASQENIEIPSLDEAEEEEASIEELSNLISDLKAENSSLQSKFLRFRKNLKARVGGVKAWSQRRRIFYDIFGTITENFEGKPKDLAETLGIETDEDSNVDIRDF